MTFPRAIKDPPRRRVRPATAARIGHGVAAVGFAASLVTIARLPVVLDAAAWLRFIVALAVLCGTGAAWAWGLFERFEKWMDRWTP